MHHVAHRWKRTAVHGSLYDHSCVRIGPAASKEDFHAIPTLITAISPDDPIILQQFVEPISVSSTVYAVQYVKCAFTHDCNSNAKYGMVIRPAIENVRFHLVGTKTLALLLSALV